MWHRWQSAFRFRGPFLVGSWLRCAQAKNTRVVWSGWLSSIWGSEPPQGASPPGSPHAGLVIPPAAISEMIDQAAVGSPAALASPLRTTKADDGRELGPVDRVEPAMLATDRHWPLHPPLRRGPRKEPMPLQKGQPLRPCLDGLCTGTPMAFEDITVGRDHDFRQST